MIGIGIGMVADPKGVDPVPDPTFKEWTDPTVRIRNTGYTKFYIEASRNPLLNLSANQMKDCVEVLNLKFLTFT